MRRIPSVMILKKASARGCVVETDLVADRPADLFAQLFGDPPGDGGRRDPPGLRAADQPRQPPAGLEAHLRDLGGLPGARLAGDDDDVVSPDRRHDGILPLQDRQGRGIDDAGQTRRRSAIIFFMASDLDNIRLSVDFSTNPAAGDIQETAAGIGIILIPAFGCQRID